MLRLFYAPLFPALSLHLVSVRALAGPCMLIGAAWLAADACAQPTAAPTDPSPRAADSFPQVINTQPGEGVPPTPGEAAAAVQAPPGFQVTLFAGEPDVSQPISMTLDDRGRLWVVECYTYAEHGYDQRFRDRIVILEDTNGDGRHDRRRVFWDQGMRLTSALVGHGGVWILNDGALQRLRDEDGDDRADGPPETMLVGFAKDRAQHNIVNGLMWGPEGWLYGRHGITANSQVGRPTDGKRVEINCSIWRYHPVHHVFQVVTNGTTNPWGMDFNEQGELFFTNNVIGHLWHVVPGAHYQRMFGEDFNPHLYELMDQTADHYHWDNSSRWTDSRDGKGVHGELGGGHSHCGGLIYLGDRWPSKYRNRILMCNTHGRRVNQNLLEREGCSYVGRRAPDFAMANNPWFRGVDLKCGPDGDVYLSDWSDLGECHDNDGVHRTSGRIYKITYGPPLPRPKLLDQPLDTRSNATLVALHEHRNDWFVRRARRLLQEREASGVEVGDAVALLIEAVLEEPELTQRLRALWTLHAMGRLPERLHLDLVDDPEEHVRAWAVRLIGDIPSQPLPPELVAAAVRLAEGERSGLVRLHLASLLQRLTRRGAAGADELDGRHQACWTIARSLSSRGEDAEDRVQPLMIWYGVEPLVVRHPQKALEMLAETQIPLLRTHIARRLTSALDSAPEPVERLLRVTEKAGSAEQRQVLSGMVAALRGWRHAKAPASWDAFRNSVAEDAQGLATELSVVFGDGREMASLREAIRDNNRDTAERRNALRVLIDSRPADFAPELHRLLGDRSVNDLAVAGLAQYDHPATAKQLLNRYRNLRPQARTQAINTLCSRKPYATELLRAVAAGRVSRDDISGSQARQMAALESPEVDGLLAENWGTVRSTPAEKHAKLQHLKTLVTTEFLAQADVRTGRKLFLQHCAGCHRLFGEGKRVAPDLTGANRDSIDYLLENLVDPSAAVPSAYRMSILRLEDGRVVSGVVTREAGPVLAVQTAKEQLLIRKDEIIQRKPSEQSLMPDNVLALLDQQQLRDLLGYLQRTSGLPPEREANGD